MKNDAGDAKLATLPKNSCSIDDIELWEDQTMMYAIDNDGYVVHNVDMTDGDFRCYHCNNCEENFGEGTYDQQKSFELVKEHFNEK